MVFNFVSRSILDKNLLLFFICFLFNVTAYAQVFTVTSVADSGPGTLRQALEDARNNGNASRDFIKFNLSGTSISDRTIIVNQTLPNVDNVSIDGSSQPGVKFGVSGAKVCITPVAGSYFNCLNITGDAEIYGLMITGFQLSGIHEGHAINIVNKCHAVIGAPGKGNVFTGNTSGIFGNIGNCIIQSNFFGVKEDGESLLANSKGIRARPGEHYVNDAIIGGSNKAEGNLLAGNEISIDFEADIPDASVQKVSIANNSFGTNFTEDSDFANSGPYFIYSNHSINILLEKNVFAASTEAISVYDHSIVEVYGNYFGTNRTQTKTLAAASNNFAVNGNSYCHFIIGGENPADQNVFAYYSNPINLSNSSTAKVIKNSFYCNSQVFINYPTTQSEFKILQFSSSGVGGIAPPNSVIQLYYSENNCSNCNPKERFAIAITDADGHWNYSGLVRGPVMASATLNESTFGFEPIGIMEQDVEIISYSCLSKGSIRILNERVGDWHFLWRDGAGRVIKEDVQRIDNLEPGEYTVEYRMLGGCTYGSEKFKIEDSKPRAATQNLTIECGKNKIEVYGNYTSSMPIPPNPIFLWQNEARTETLGSDKTMQLGPGKYYFSVKDATGCFSDAALITILPPPAIPMIDEQNVMVAEASCAGNDGSITGISASVSDNLPIKYEWYVSGSSIPISFTKDVDQLAPGKYILKAYESTGTCFVFSNEFEVKGKNDKTFVEASEVISPVTCAGMNGSIQVEFSNFESGDRYIWYKADGTESIGNGKKIDHLSPGIYKLYLEAAGGCEKFYKSYDVPLGNLAPLKPGIKDIFICTGSEITVRFKEVADAYRIYDADGLLLSNAETPDLRIKVNETSEFYAAVVNGECESERTKFKVIVRTMSIKIPNAFSPNGDGINDKWVLEGLDVYMSVDIKVFNRYGTLIYQSVGKASPFNGKYKGTDLPAGVYFYLIKLSNDCSPLTGSLTLLK